MEEKCGLQALMEFDRTPGRIVWSHFLQNQIEIKDEEERSRLESLPHCGKCEYCLEAAREDAEWRREMAMEAGMLHGASAYNEAMGWDLEDSE